MRDQQQSALRIETNELTDPMIPSERHLGCKRASDFKGREISMSSMKVNLVVFEL